MYFTKTPFLIQSLGSRFMWKLKVEEGEKKIALTFDDGPVPEVTEWVLDLLNERRVQATFFCVGENVSKHNEIFHRIIQERHVVGNHTYNHLNAWKTTRQKYIQNVDLCEQILPSKDNTPLFRPPYGRITPGITRQLGKRYSLVMWDVLSGDFDSRLSAGKCLRKTVRQTVPGSIVVFHDSMKSWNLLQKVLPDYIDVMKEQGFDFDVIQSDK